MKKFSHFIAMIAFLLTVCIFVSSYPCQLTCAAAGQDVQLSKQYLKEVKMFYGETPEEAKAACEEEGYTFCPTNLNEGAPTKRVQREKATEPGNNAGYYNNNQNKYEFHDRVTGVYMGYTTTEDPEDAITDLTLLDMKNTHYTELDYQQYLNDHLSDFTDEAAQMMVLVGEFRRKMEAGSPNAKLVYDALNLIYVDENKPHDATDNQLGYYLLNDVNANITFFEKFIQRGNAKVLNRITDLLCNAAADYDTGGETWVDRSKTSEVAVEYENGTSDVKNMYDSICEDPANQLIKAIKDFSATYTEAKQRYDQYGDTYGYPELEGMTEENAHEKLAAAGSDCRFPEYSDAMKTYALLDSITYQTAGETVENNAGLLAEPEVKEEATEANGSAPDAEPATTVTITYSSNVTLAQYFMNLASDASLEDHPSTVYPIVHALTPAQRSALSLGGLSAITEELFQAKDYAPKSTQATNEAIEKLKEIGLTDGRLYLWAGTDNSIFEKKVVQTKAADEAKAAGRDLEESISKAALKDDTTLQQALEIVDLVTTAFSGVMMIVGAITSANLWILGSFYFTMSGLYLTFGAVGSAIGSALLGTLLCALHLLNILATVVSILLLVYNILMWCGVFDSPDYVDYSEIPDVVMDARQKEKGTYSVRYDSVHSNATGYKAFLEKKYNSKGIYMWFGGGMSDEHAEMNAFESLTDRWVALFYSKAPAAGEPIEVTPGQELFVTSTDHTPPEGYRPLSLIIGSMPEDVNSVEYLGGETGTPLYVYFPGEVSQRQTGGVISDDGRYVTGATLSYSDNRQDAINRLKKSNYEYIDVNLTPYQGYTFLGYKLGGSEGALTDIRLSNNAASTVVFGDASYAKMGADTDNTGSTPDGMALFVTTDKSAGSPIMGLTIENTRLEKGSGMEPVCLFSGGDAVDIGKKWKDNILNTKTADDAVFFFDKGGANDNYFFDSRGYSYQYLQQEDPYNGIYLYFQPKEQFKATDADGNPAQRYIAGFSYFLAGDKETYEEQNQFGSNYEYMQTFARENGFELLTDGGEPLRVMSDEAGEMTMATVWRDVGGYPVDTYKFDQYHTVTGNYVVASGDHGVIPEAGLAGDSKNLYSRLSRHKKNMIYHTAMYFGVSYTYNPYRAITGVSGLLTPYTETTKQIKYEGMKTPAGTFQPCNVSMQGCPMMSAGITAGYYNFASMSFPLYTNYEARQRSDLSWMTHEENEILSRYLMTSGPRKDILPLKEGDIAFSTSENPGTLSGYVPICDLRTPGDYDHPLNFALDTTNKGSKYLYLYLKNTAGGRKADKSTSNVYSAKTYVAAVFCGVGRNPETAIADLYSKAAGMWKDVAALNKDISPNPLVTEFDEIIPVDLSSEHPWYDLYCGDTSINSLPNGEWVYGNEHAHYRWEGYDRVDYGKKTIDEYEKDQKCAYVGVVRTAKKTKAAYGVLKYYSNEKEAPSTLNSGSTKCIKAGGPVNSKEGKYFLYYSTNSGTAAYQAPITSLHISDDIFINGYNTVFTVSESDRVDNQLPQYGQLRMRTDEYKYIHLGYERKDLPYYEAMYLGVGKTKNEAFADMIGTTNAYAAIDVNCNYNSYSDQWIAVGYRRTSSATSAIRDVFLYQGDDPPAQIRASGAYMESKDSAGNTIYAPYKDKKGNEGVVYKLVKHNLKSGSEILSLNKGNGGENLYLYYTTTEFYSGQSAESLVTPITNMCFTYGDISPRLATAEQLASVFEHSYYAKKTFDASAYEKPIWECVLGVSGSPENWKVTGEGASRFSLNQGITPGLNGNGWTGSDNRVYMYVDRADSNATTSYCPRENAKLPEFGYYSPESTFGYLKQVS